MGREISVPRSDGVDRDLFAEPRETASATEALWRILQVSRTER